MYRNLYHLSYCTVLNIQNSVQWKDKGHLASISDFKRNICRAPGWLIWLSFWLAQVMICASWIQTPCQALCWQLRAWSLLQILCFPISLPLSSSTLSLKNKYTLKKTSMHALFSPPLSILLPFRLVIIYESIIQSGQWSLLVIMVLFLKNLIILCLLDIK